MVIVMLSLPNFVLAQDIAVLPADPSVTSGVLPNGMKWYVVANPYVKGTADFAVVQMTGSSTVPGAGRKAVVEQSREALSVQPLLLSPSVQEFFLSKGSLPGPEGFARVDENATIFRFRNVNLKLSDSVLDSTLLVLTGIVGRNVSDQSGLSGWYSPSDQAVIVVGDVDAGVVSEKLKMLSYMVPSSTSFPRPGYEWKDADGVKVEFSDAPDGSLGQVVLKWRLQRTPKELMNTVMPSIYSKYMTMAGTVARERILADMQAAGIPVASVESAYVGGAETLGDEEFSITVCTGQEHLDKALSVAAKVMSSLDSYGADAREVRSAGYAFADMLYTEDGGSDIRNAEYVDRCIYSFICNTPLSSRKDIRKFHISRILPDSTECALFHSIVSSSVDGGKNLTIRVSADSAAISAESMEETFDTSWKSPSRREAAVRQMPRMMAASGIKIKVKSSKKEYLSGGTMMTLSNGIKIIYRNMPTEDDKIYYTFSLSGGAGNVEGLCSDDGGYLADFFGLCRIGGVPGHVFREVLRQQGMTLGCEVGHSTTDFSGEVPYDRLDCLFSALLTMMNSREADPEEWEYYFKGEQLRQKAGCASGHEGCLTEDFAGRADKFFDTLSGKVNDGVIVLVGRIDEKRLKETALLYAGGFRTSDRTFTRTETYNGSMAGKSAIVRKGDLGNVTIHISAPMPLTSDNFYASAMTSMVLRRNLAMASAGKGMRVRVSHECRRHPQENLSMNVSLSEVPTDGFASGTEDYSKEDAFAAVREVMSDLSGLQMDEDMLASYRYRLERHLQLEKEKPEYWLEAIRLRYMEGKDFTTGAEARIQALTETHVRKILSMLDNGTKVEYIITER